MRSPLGVRAIISDPGTEVVGGFIPASNRALGVAAARAVRTRTRKACARYHDMSWLPAPHPCTRHLGVAWSVGYESLARVIMTGADFPHPTVLEI